MIKDDYINKKLEKFYRRQIRNRFLSLSREECDNKFGTGEFFHLNTHTKFSILNGIDDPSDLFAEAQNQNMKGLAITETGYMSSIPDCFLAAQKTNMKYIVGISAYFSDYEDTRRRILEDENDDVKNHPALIHACRPYRTPQITILAKNEEGYRELVNINTESWKDGYYYVPRISRRILEKYTNGNLIILSGNLIDKFIEFGYVTGIENPEYNALSAYDYMKWFHNQFGDDFFMELTFRCQDSVFGSDLDRLSTQAALINKLNEEENVVLQEVITNDVRYINKKHEKLYRTLLAIGRNTTLKRIKDYSSELYFKTRSELRGTYYTCYYDRAIDEKRFEMACDQSIKIADLCNSFKADTSPKLPEINNADEKLKNEAVKGLIRHGFHKDTQKYEVDGKMVTYFEQMQIELNRFIEKGFSSYFLIMQDLIKHSHSLGWQTGPARGSAGGSLVCYLLGIVSMNPIQFRLSFDRFLSPSRGGNMLKITMD